MLTAENRDAWADARQIILDASPDNKKALERVESAIIVVALDDSKPVTREQISRGIWVGDGRSRWFDKHQRKFLGSLVIPNLFRKYQKLKRLHCVIAPSRRLRQWSIWFQRRALLHGRNTHLPLERLAPPLYTRQEDRHGQPHTNTRQQASFPFAHQLQPDRKSVV